MIFDLFNGTKKKKTTQQQEPQISRDELREFLINNNLEGELKKRVLDLKTRNADLTNYEAVEMLMDHLENKSH